MYCWSMAQHALLLYWYQKVSDIRSSGSLLLHALILITTLVSNHKPGKVWDEITYPFPNFNGVNVGSLEIWIGDFISHFSVLVITYPCWLLLSRRAYRFSCQVAHQATWFFKMTLSPVQCCWCNHVMTKCFFNNSGNKNTSILNNNYRLTMSGTLLLVQMSQLIKYIHMITYITAF